ncbi:MAG: hypothetical protein ACJAVR_003653 [Paracoccaceae bacterium]|jgi:uncharacterized protein YneF (UPF0154 family)
MTAIIQTLFVITCLALLGFLGGWGITVRRLVRQIEDAHPQDFEILRARSRKGGRRLAVTSAVQQALTGGGDTLPEAIRKDPACVALMVREGRLRLMMLGAGLLSGLFFLLL